MNIKDFIFHRILSCKEENIHSYYDMLTRDRFPYVIPITMGKAVELMIGSTIFLAIINAFTGIIHEVGDNVAGNFLGLSYVFNFLKPLYIFCIGIIILNYILTITGIHSFILAIFYSTSKEQKRNQILETIWVLFAIWVLIIPSIGYIRPIANTNTYRVRQEKYYVGETLYVSDELVSKNREAKTIVDIKEEYVSALFDTTTYIFEDGTTSNDVIVLGQVVEKDGLWILKAWYTGFRDGIYKGVMSKILPELNL